MGKKGSKKTMAHFMSRLSRINGIKKGVPYCTLLTGMNVMNVWSYMDRSIAITPGWWINPKHLLRRDLVLFRGGVPVLILFGTVPVDCK